MAILTDGVAPQLLDTPNAMRVTLHPDGLAPRIGNFEEWSAHLMERLHRQFAASGDPDLAALIDELRGYPGVSEGAGAAAVDPAAALFVPLVLQAGGKELRFFSTLATFGTALDITIAELSIESFFPADEATTAALR
jgi:hypothetical protein